MSLGEDGHSRLRAGFKFTAHECCPCYDRAVTDFGEPARTSHNSKMVLSIVKFGGPSLRLGTPDRSSPVCCMRARPGGL